MRKYIVYDGRACGGLGTDNAMILATCDSDDEAKDHAGDFGDMSCYSYKLLNHVLSDERWEWDWEPGFGFIKGQ